MTETKHIKARVIERRDVSSDLWIVRLQPEEKLVFAPGQYATIGMTDGAKLVERPYSLGSSPGERDLEFFLELVPGGHLTPHLYHVPVGGEVLVRRQAKGRFLFDAASTHRDHLMIATVTGVAPFLSMIREMAAHETEGDPAPYRVALLHCASVSRELGYLDELNRFANEHAWLRYIPSVSRPWEDTDWAGELGRAEDIARKHLHLLGFRPQDTTAYVCGNPRMIENVKGVLERTGFPKESVKQEVYWLASKEG